VYCNTLDQGGEPYYYRGPNGVSGVWQAWLMPWAPLWWGRKNCLAKNKMCDLQYLQPLFVPHTINNCITASIQHP